jgi:hypothetical protein
MRDAARAMNWRRETCSGERAMQRRRNYLQAAISLLLGLPLALGPWAAQPGFAQTAPSCPGGYYYASDGYCYPQPQPTYAYPPPVYDPAPPVYQPAPVVDGVAIGVGLGLLFGALASGSSNHGDNHAPPARNDRGGNRAPVHDDRGGDRGQH